MTADVKEFLRRWSSAKLDSPMPEEIQEWRSSCESPVFRIACITLLVSAIPIRREEMRRYKAVEIERKKADGTYREWIAGRVAKNRERRARNPIPPKHSFPRNPRRGKKGPITPEMRQKLIAGLREWARKKREAMTDEQRLTITRAKRAAYARKYRRENLNGWLSLKLRNRLIEALVKNRKSAKSAELLGCTIQELKVHLESQFTDGMTWENRGQWHIDHIRPCASFDLSKPEEQRACFHFTNLQPKWRQHNQAKSSHWNGKYWRRAKPPVTLTA
jgi:hypothetical protein